MDTLESCTNPECDRAATTAFRKIPCCDPCRLREYRNESRRRQGEKLPVWNNDRHKRRPEIVAMEKEVDRLAEEGHTITDIAETLGASYRRVTYLLYGH